MARTAYGELISVDSDTALYRFAVDPREAWDGELIIPGHDVEEAYVVGSSDFPFAARMVLVRAYQHREEEGVWPDSVKFLS